MIRRPPRSTLFPTRRSSDLGELRDHGPRHHATCPRRSDADTGSVPPSSGEAVREPSRAAFDPYDRRSLSRHRPDHVCQPWIDPRTWRRCDLGKRLNLRHQRDRLATARQLDGDLLARLKQFGKRHALLQQSLPTDFHQYVTGLHAYPVGGRTRVDRCDDWWLEEPDVRGAVTPLLLQLDAGGVDADPALGLPDPRAQRLDATHQPSLLHRRVAHLRENQLR